MWKLRLIGNNNHLHFIWIFLVVFCFCIQLDSHLLFNSIYTWHLSVSVCVCGGVFVYVYFKSSSNSYIWFKTCFFFVANLKLYIFVKSANFCYIFSLETRTSHTKCVNCYCMSKSIQYETFPTLFRKSIFEIIAIIDMCFWR